MSHVVSISTMHEGWRGIHAVPHRPHQREKTWERHLDALGKTTKKVSLLAAGSLIDSSFLSLSSRKCFPELET